MIQKLLRKARKGTKLVYIPGNHDENFRNFLNLRFGRVAVLEETIHLCANGKRYLVLHGDKFDGVVRFAPWLAKLGDTAYEVSMELNAAVNRVRRLFRLPYWSLSAYLKNRVKKAVEFISHFEDAVVREARARNCQGVICGHIHTPDDRHHRRHPLSQRRRLGGELHGARRTRRRPLRNHQLERRCTRPDRGRTSMRILIVTDAWSPQVNGVVRTLNAVIAELEAQGPRRPHHQSGRAARPGPCRSTPRSRSPA